MKIYFSIFVLLSFLNSQSQSIHSAKKQEIFDIGYRNIILTDSARHYKPGAPNSNKLYYRPVEIDLWYPAIISNFNHSIRYGAFLNLLEERSNRFQDDTMYTSISSDLVQYLSANLKITDNSKLTLGRF
jgi:hypothetical protein